MFDMRVASCYLGYSRNINLPYSKTADQCKCEVLGSYMVVKAFHKTTFYRQAKLWTYCFQEADQYLLSGCCTFWPKYSVSVQKPQYQATLAPSATAHVSRYVQACLWNITYRMCSLRQHTRVCDFIF